MVSELPHKSPDIFNGTASRLRFHLFLWEVTRQDEDLRDAVSCGEYHISAAEEVGKDEVQLRIPQEYGSGSEQAYIGYAHGVAGIADALLDLYDVTPTPRIIKTVRASVNRLAATATVVIENNSGIDWPSTDGGETGGGFWCHGSAGIARFLLKAVDRKVSPIADKLAKDAAKTAANGVRWAGPTQCHGLSGNIEVLLDFFQSTGKQRYLDSAITLSTLL